MAATTDEPQRFSFTRIDKLDVLFVIDNTDSMEDSQAALSAQLPRLVQALSQGQRSPNDPVPFTPVTDLHVGVVSTDLGVAGMEIGDCHGDGGDNGRLAPGGACGGDVPSFLAYDAQTSSGLGKLSDDLACMAALGSDGCGLQQPLEAALKALWPMNYLDANGKLVTTNPIAFLSATPDNRHGLGDVPPEQGGNLGFLRKDALLLIVAISKDDDCSVESTAHLAPTEDGASEYEAAVLGLQCLLNPDLNYDVIKRYYRAFRGLKPGYEDRVYFAAIVGVPTDLVDAKILDATNFGDPLARDNFYAAIFDDPRMAPAIDPVNGPAGGNFKSSCRRTRPNGDTALAGYAPRRIVSLAKAFGENGMVQSICQDDLGPAIDFFVSQMAKRLRGPCVPRPVRRNSNGTVNCNVQWQLSEPNQQPTDAALRRCAELGTLISPTYSGGSVRCEIPQLATPDAAGDRREGWYYDDVTPELDRVCPNAYTQRIAFTAGAQPPRGLRVKIECIGAN